MQAVCCSTLALTNQTTWCLNAKTTVWILTPVSTKNIISPAHFQVLRATYSFYQVLHKVYNEWRRRTTINLMHITPIKIALKKNFYTLTHFTQLKSTFVNRELRTVSHNFIIVVCWFKILCALSKYSWIVFKFCLVTLCKYFIDCIYWTAHISLYKLNLLLRYHNHKLLSCILLSRLILYYACCYLMTSSISTLMDLWNTKWMNEWLNLSRKWELIKLTVLIIKPTRWTNYSDLFLE